MIIFFIFENFSKNKKDWRFLPTANQGTFLAQFTQVHIFYTNKCIFIL